MLNNKGSCGKTSLCSGIATSMAELGLRVLVIDGDGQRNLSASFSICPARTSARRCWPSRT